MKKSIVRTINSTIYIGLILKVSVILKLAASNFCYAFTNL